MFPSNLVEASFQQVSPAAAAAQPPPRPGALPRPPASLTPCPAAPRAGGCWWAQPDGDAPAWERLFPRTRSRAAAPRCPRMEEPRQRVGRQQGRAGTEEGSGGGVGRETEPTHGVGKAAAEPPGGTGVTGTTTSPSAAPSPRSDPPHQCPGSGRSSAASLEGSSAGTHHRPPPPGSPPRQPLAACKTNSQSRQ